MRSLAAACLAGLLAAGTAAAAPAGPAAAPAAPAVAAPAAPLPDPALERRATALSHQLRCVVCQNQAIADSQAELAVDLRRQVREQLAKGLSDQQVADYLVQRYGEFVLYRPPLKSSTWLLWFGPALLLGGGLLAFGLRLRSARRDEAAPDPQALARAAALLKDPPETP